MDKLISEIEGCQNVIGFCNPCIMDGNGQYVNGAASLPGIIEIKLKERIPEVNNL